MANIDDGAPPDEPKVEPNIAQIAKLIGHKGPVHRAEEKAQDGRSDLGNLYKRIQDDHHGHRGAVKLVRKLLAGTDEAAMDFMRTFEPLAEHFNLFPEQRAAAGEGDLVDVAEQGQGPKPGKSALENARAHLSGGTKPDETPPGGEGGAPGEAGPRPEPEVSTKAGKGRAKLGIVAGTDAETKH